MARFMERFKDHLANDPELRAEYERLAQHFGALSAELWTRASVEEVRTAECGSHSGSQ